MLDVLLIYSDNLARLDLAEVTELHIQGGAMAQNNQGLKIRIRLKAYDHKVIDQSAKQIIDTALHWCKRRRPCAATNTAQQLHSGKEPTRI